MLARVITGVIGIPVAIVIIFYPGGLPLTVAAAVVAFLGGFEFYSGVRRSGARPITWTGLAATVLFVVAARVSDSRNALPIFASLFTLLLILSFLVELLRFNRAPLTNIGTTVTGAVYVGWLISHVVMLRGIGGHTITLWSYSEKPGAWLVMFAFLCTWACDTGAFIIGRLYGKTKLAPKLSPNKTLEGSIAGLVCSVLAAALFGLVIDLPPQHALALGAIIGLMTQLGDLSESAVKRELRIKDFGNLLPGHGGILDRFDSLLFTGPATYYYAVFLLRGWLG